MDPWPYDMDLVKETNDQRPWGGARGKRRMKGKRTCMGEKKTTANGTSCGTEEDCGGCEPSCLRVAQGERRSGQIFLRVQFGIGSHFHGSGFCLPFLSSCHDSYESVEAYHALR